MSGLITIFLCGDVMTGRGIDQLLPRPSDPRLHEPYVRDARRYLELAERECGPLAKPVDHAYVWGESLALFARLRPQVRIVNLETSITVSDDYWPGKGINYRMHPANIRVLTVAGIDACALANNHVLDWGYGGLAETLLTLEKAGLQSAGAGRDLAEAGAPAVVAVPGKGRVLLFSFGTESSGIPRRWGASAATPGVNLLPDLSEPTAEAIGRSVLKVKRPGDLAVASIHWGGNWGYDIPREETAFAHRLIDRAGIDLLHGHSSHHAKGIEVYRGKPVIYGCGDFINDYEGIGGYEEFRGDLSVMYFASFEPASGRFAGLRLVPLQMKRFRLNRAGQADREWLRKTLTREGKRFATGLEAADGDSLELRWQ